jgi:hypothetical protein
MPFDGEETPNVSLCGCGGCAKEARNTQVREGEKGATFGRVRDCSAADIRHRRFIKMIEKIIALMPHHQKINILTWVFSTKIK